MKGGDAKQQNTKKKGGENNELHQKKLVFALAHHITIWLHSLHVILSTIKRQPESNRRATKTDITFV